MRITERIAFLKQFRRQLASTGAVQPSSRFLAREMASRVRTARRGDDGPVRIVEMGPGTGAVTCALAAAMGPGDQLDCYEINREFADYLRWRVDTDARFGEVRARIRVHCAAAQDAEPPGAVDFVVCSVPLNNLPPPVVEAIFARGMALLAASGGWFTFFEYPVLPQLKRWISGRAERRRISAVTLIKREARGERSHARNVLLNIPPARAVHIPVGNAGGV